MKFKPTYLSIKLGAVTEFDSNEKPTSDIEILRVGTLFDRNMNIKLEMLTDMVKHFKENVVGQELSVNKDHTAGEACGWITDVFILGECLHATVQWTSQGYELIKSDSYRYVSIEFYEKYPKATDGKKLNNVITGLALTNIPALKHQKALTLSQNINLTNCNMFEKLLMELLAKETVLEADYSLAETLLAEIPEEEKLGYEDKMKALKEKMAKCKQDIADLEKSAKQKMSTLEKDKIVLVKVTEENILLSERLAQLEAKNRKTELSVKADSVVLSESTTIGVPTAKKDEVVEFMESLTDDQVDSFITLMSGLQSYESGVAGKATNAEDVEGKVPTDVEAKLAMLNTEADKVCASTGRPRSEVLAELTPKYYA